MGTSTARRGPSTGAWRYAKGVATRYLSPEGSAPVEARELVSRYVAALQETGAGQGQDLLAEFRLIRKAAQCLGEFGDMVAGSGLAPALAAWGQAALAQSPPEVAILGLTSVWVEEPGGLETQVARTALAKGLAKVFAAETATNSRLDGPALVRTFLADALCLRLALDLGEPLEAAAPGYPEYRQGLARLEDELQAASAVLSKDPPRPGQWQGLAGWLWTTEVLEHILNTFQDHS
jgi:hypothetical protein